MKLNTCSCVVATIGFLAVSVWPVSAKDDNGTDDKNGVPHRLEALEAVVAAMRGENATQKATIATLQAAVTTVQTRAAELDAALTALRASPALALAPYLAVKTETINGLKGPHVILEGVNLHVRSGSGSTEDGHSYEAPGIPTGRGNIIIGYNEAPQEGTAELLRTGSHCLVVGGHHRYLSWGGLVAGYDNGLTGPAASVLGGSANSAGSGAAVLGGNYNVASGAWHQCIAGGAWNTVSGWASSVSGGWHNTASGGAASVTGGHYNLASDWVASVHGGWSNTASTGGASVCGGLNNIASGTASTVVGGMDNIARGEFAAVGGGSGNEASGDAATVSGGGHRKAIDSSSWAGGGLYQNY